MKDRMKKIEGIKEKENDAKRKQKKLGEECTNGIEQ